MSNMPGDSGFVEFCRFGNYTIVTSGIGAAVTRKPEQERDSSGGVFPLVLVLDCHFAHCTEQFIGCSPDHDSFFGIRSQ